MSLAFTSNISGSLNSLVPQCVLELGKAPRLMSRRRLSNRIINAAFNRQTPLFMFLTLFLSFLILPHHLVVPIIRSRSPQPPISAADSASVLGYW